MPENIDLSVMNRESLAERFRKDATEGGAVYKVPKWTDRFLRFSWVAVLPSGKVALTRWTPTPEEDISLARKRDENCPSQTGLSMWREVSVEEAAEKYVESNSEEMVALGTVTVVEDKPHLDLMNPHEETDRPKAFEELTPING